MELVGTKQGLPGSTDASVMGFLEELMAQAHCSDKYTGACAPSSLSSDDNGVPVAGDTPSAPCGHLLGLSTKIGI